MKLIEVTEREYSGAFPRPAVAYNSVAFTRLNAAKVDAVRRLMICADSGSPLLGLTVGEKDGQLRAPFSAPFACLDFNRDHGAEVMLEAARLLRESLPGLRLTLPPAFYAAPMIDKTFLALLAAGAQLVCADWNYHIDLARGDFEAHMTSAARNKLRRLERLGLQFAQCDLPRAYEVIRRNRQNKGYGLAMTLEQVAATVGKGGPLRADFFVMTDGDADAAAAIVYRTAPRIAQVIYWGDDNCPGATNLLALRVADFYAAQGFRTLDVGPSGADGIPNPGLSDFKDSLGCLTTPKPTLLL